MVKLQVHLVDAHFDCANRLAFERARGKRSTLGKLFIKAMSIGGVRACVLSIWAEERYRSDPSTCMQRSLFLLRTLEEEIASEPMAVVPKGGSDYRSIAKDTSKITFLLSMEGLNGVEENLGLLEELRGRGVVMAGLTWNEGNALAGGALDYERGITPSGKSCLKLMEDLGIVLDLAHLNDKSFFEALQSFEGEVVVSHTACRELCGHPRNLSSEMMLEIARRGGVIGIAAIPRFLREDGAAHIDDFLAHLSFAVEKVGVEHVGFGFDFSYMLEDVGISKEREQVVGISRHEEAINVLSGLKKMGFREDEISSICHENWDRIFSKLKDL